MKKQVEINEDFRKALDLLEHSGRNVFITGKAGTGKSTLLDYFRNSTSKKVVVLAPTGVAAVNIQGQTIHSFFHFKPDITLEKVKRIKSEKSRKLYREIDIIVIDEISMVRPDILDCVDKFMRLNGRNPRSPFGGAQMIFFGDLYQLPPVVQEKERVAFGAQYKSSYFFNAKVIECGAFKMEFVELHKVYRQTDEEFIHLLNSIRNNTVTEEQLQLLNRRLQEEGRSVTGRTACTRLPSASLGFAERRAPRGGTERRGVYLTTTNRLAARINEEHLNRIHLPLYSYKGIAEGEFGREHLPAELELKIKSGSQVMLLNNDREGRWINGAIGSVESVKEKKGEQDVINVRLPEGQIEEIYPWTWELFRFSYNEKTASIESDIIGRFTQYPLKLAWAVTIHKSQGKTFDRVVLDISDGVFACGQIYVALSRCRCLEGITLTRPIQKKHIFVDRKIMEFLTSFQYKISEEKTPIDEKIRRIKDAIEKNGKLAITYLKTSDEKSHRIIRPLFVGEMSYQDKEFIGVSAHCFERGEVRVFRVDRILEMEEAK